MDTVDCVVIGAGAVGLAIARAIAQAGHETLIVEKEPIIGAGISSRNSEVIHAGLYYAPQSMKAQFCVDGRRRLYEFCTSHGVAHRKCGKLVVATSPVQIAELEALFATALANGVNDLVWLDHDQCRRVEPALSARAALYSPSSGIIDSHGYMLALLGDAEAAGAVVAFGTQVSRIASESDAVAVWINAEKEPVLRARVIINAAGLNAIDVARCTDGFPAAHLPRGWYAKGSYFSLTGRTPFAHLIYPVPEPGGLGIHVTLDLAGQARFGPDVEWLGDNLQRPDYKVDPRRAEGFYNAIRAYWPGLKDDALSPAYAGIRPKLSGPGAPAADFRIDGPAHHGVASIIHLFGIESPGLTSSLAIADEVVRQAETIDG